MKLIIGILLINGIAAIPDNGDALPVIHYKIVLIDERNPVHIYDTISIAAQKLRIAEQKRCKHIKLLIGADYPFCRVNLYVVIVIVRINNIL